MNIAVDVDGTIMKTSCFICSLINFRTKKNFNFKQIDRWTYWQDIGMEEDFWDSYSYMDKYGRLLIEPYDEYVLDSLQEINKITKDKFTLLTANNKEAAEHINDWMFYHYTEYYLPYYEIECIGRVTCAEKLSLPFDLYIDDNPNMAREIINFPNKKMIIMNCPWNKEIENTDQVVRAESWEEVPKLIESI